MRLLFIHLLQAMRHWRCHGWQMTLSALGMVLGLVCFSFGAADLWHRMHYDSFRTGYKQLYVASGHIPGDGLFSYGNPIPYLRHVELKNSLPAGSRMTVVGQYPEGVEEIIVSDTLSIKKIDFGMAVDSLFADVMDVRVLRGNMADLHTLPDRIVLTDSLARRLFGTDDVVGRTLVLKRFYDDRQMPRTVAAVVRYETHTALPFTFLTPYVCSRIPEREAVRVYVRTDCPDEVLRRWEQVDKRFNSTSVGLPEYTELHPLRTYPLTHMKGDFWRAAFYPLTFVLLSALLLLSAAFNYMALLTSMCIGRLHEYRLRLCLGGGFRDNLCRLLTELLLMFGCVWVMGVVLMEYVSYVYEPLLTDAEMPPGVYKALTTAQLYGYYMFFAAVLLMLLLVLAVYPAHRLHCLYRHSLAHNRGHVLNTALLGVQMVVSILLLFLLVNGYRQFRFMTRDGLGFSPDRVLAAEYIWDDRGSAERYRMFIDPATLDEVRRSSDAVETVLLARTQLVNSSMRMTTQASNIREGAAGQVAAQAMQPGLVSLFDMDVTDLNGRPIHYTGGDDKVLVNPRAVDVLGLTEDDPWITFRGRRWRVGGVIDLRTRRFDEPEVPTVFTPDTTFYTISQILVKFRSGRRDEAVSAIGRALERVGFAPGTYYVSGYSNIILEQYTEEQYYLILFGGLAVAGFGITLFGVLAFVTYELRRSRRDMAVRRIFGADYRRLCSRYLFTYLRTVALAAVVALPVGYLLIGRWLQIYADRISVGLWPAMLAVAVVMLFTAGVVMVCLYRAMRERPAEVLQGE